MSTRPTSSEALAEALKGAPPALDELARARMERRVVAAASAPRAQARPRRRAVALGAGALLAAAAALALFLASEGEPEAPVARIDLHEVGASVQRGTLEEGSLVRTGAREEADIQVADTSVRVGGASRVRIATLSPAHLALELLEGDLRVAYHPRARGRERMTVETPSARVEVVGTVFRVEVRESGTRVSVSEGTVRVVPLDGSEARLVHAGEHTHVPREAHAEASPEADEAPSPEVVPAAQLEAAPDVGAPALAGPAAEALEDEVAEAPADPAARLELAQRLIARGRVTAAARILRELARPSVPAAVRTEALSTAGDLHRGAGRWDEAAGAYEQAAQVGRGTAGGHNAIFALARLHAQRGDAAAARASYERYLREAPDGALAGQARRALARLGGGEE